MKSIENKSITQLLTIIPEHPAMRIMQISDGGEPLYRRLQSFCLAQEYEYLNNVIDNAFYESIKEESNSEALSFVKKITLEQRVYASMSKQYDFIFVSATIPEAFENEFAKKIHRYIKNAGNLILFLPKGEGLTLQRWYAHLEEHLFVAINSIDMFENYEILIAKKMHGWGGK